ncbi:hypothetical protein [Corynebacterium freiburgense]|uniref:hypothetical protein n=1 Tax=Corynebacterium freiburgense TaxID=556548 RepID=UPI00040334F2|nr:hypothetical protein [Corynebacterium freiburgense]WJZ03797.1 hypothetical protein CFREI_12700 [Corynebacterium freiburgense]
MLIAAFMKIRSKGLNSTFGDQTDSVQRFIQKRGAHVEHCNSVRVSTLRDGGVRSHLLGKMPGHHVFPSGYQDKKMSLDERLE